MIFNRPDIVCDRHDARVLYPIAILESRTHTTIRDIHVRGKGDVHAYFVCQQKFTQSLVTFTNRFVLPKHVHVT